VVRCVITIVINQKAH